MARVDLVFAFLVSLVCLRSTHAATTCNVLNYGAKADNATNLAPAILSAYNNCVKSAPGNILLIPAGKFLMASTVSLGGSSYTFQIDGTITLAFDPSIGGTMIEFSHCNAITFTGTGIIYGQGNLWRPDGNLEKYPGRPRLLRFEDCDNCQISGVTLNNSPMFHLTLIGDNNEISDIVVVADIIGETDAFDVSGNNNYVHDVEVTNGDECVTVKTPTNGFTAKNVICHHSAGCNIGSFGDTDTVASVQNVYYYNVTMYNSDAGAQLKTFPNNLGFVKNVTYDTFTLTAVDYPIALNLYWCPHSDCPTANGTLTVSDFTFKNIHGTSATNARPGVLLDCLPKYMCKDITFIDVTITAPNGPNTNSFKNACGTGLPDLPAC